MNLITWTCHICGRERPDAKISVHKRKLRARATDIELSENIRYCNDRVFCTEAAPDFRLLPDDKYEVIDEHTY